MSKKGFVIGILVGIVVGFSIGFFWTNSVNRSVVKEAQDRIHSGETKISSNNSTSQDKPTPNDRFHKGDFESQIGDVVKVAEQNRNDVEIQTKAGEILYFKAKKYSEARQCFEAALKLKPNDYSLIVNLGNVNFDDEKYEEAAKWYEKAIKINSSDVNVRTDLGITYYLRDPKQLDKAIENYRISLKLDSNHIPTLRNLAAALVDKKNSDEAKIVIEKLAQLDPQNEALPDLKVSLDKLTQKMK